MPRILCRHLYAKPLLVLSLLLLLMSLPGGQHSFWNFLRPSVKAATTLVVTNDGDGGAGSLRQAILDANSTPGLDTIIFAIGSGPKTIKPLQRLPTLTDPIVIDGTTQPGFSGTPIIELDGSLQPDGNGFLINGGDSTVRGLVINNFRFDGILIGLKGGNHVEGCYIGTDTSGASARPNGLVGIATSVSNNVIGGTTSAARNVISGNNGVGVNVARFCCTGDQSPITGNVIQGNYIGLNAAGNAAIPNAGEGIRITSVNANVPVTGNVVGGTQPGAGNVVSGNSSVGVTLEGFFVTNNTVQGNFIGTDVNGSFAIPNDRDGISITGSNNLIGGPTANARNVISGNGRTAGGNGVSVNGDSAQGNVVQGNVIGANAALTGPLPNLQHGLAITGTNSIIGGTNVGEGNVIAFNGYDGIVDAGASSTGNSFRGNSIFSNGFLNHPSGVIIGIDLGNNGVTPNDQGDGDSGVNNLQNFPVITSVTASVNAVNIKGTLNSTAVTSFNLDFYANSVCDPSGFGEGARFVGAAIVTTNPSGDASFDLNFLVTLPPGQVFTATATNPTGNTSEFSQCSAITNAVGSIGFRNNSVSVSESDGLAIFVVDRSGGSLGALTFNYDVTSQTAREGFDFGATHGTLTFADGETSQMFTVPIIDDNVDESFETAKVTLSTSGALDTLGSQSMATLTITDNDPPPNISISDWVLTEGNSGTKNAFITVTLSAPSGFTVSADFNTSNGTASSGSDYQGTAGSVIFSPGITVRNIIVAVAGDSAVEPDETFFVNLSNPQNASISRAQATVTIINDDNNGGNSIDLPGFFVRQHYLDFLTREPDTAGLAFWTHEIEVCGTDAACIDNKRVNVSAAFFLSIEFQETGYLVERIYKSAYGDAIGTSNFGSTHQLPVPVIRLNEFLPDTREIGNGVVVGVGNWQAQLENNKVAFTQNFVSRSRFINKYATTLTPPQFVDSLYFNAGVTPSAAERTSVIGEFGGAGNSADTAARARALRRVAENSTLNQQENNKAFVLMQYFGYLRRNPNDSPDSDYSGYDFWLSKLNQFNGNFVNAEMVKAFIVSGEYRQRFGP